MRKLPKTLLAAELEQLLSMPNVATPTGLRDRCMMELMVRAGLRVSEVCGLRVRDVDWREGEIRLRPEITKGSKEAVIYVDETTLKLLEQWKTIRRRYAAGKPHLFVCVRSAQRGQPLDRRRVWAMIDRRSRKAAMVHAWPHMLRHTFATTLLSEGFTIRDVQELMRHSDIRTTAIYLDVRNEDLKAKMRARRPRAA
jgi:integrase/recombinase XerD